MAKLKKEVTATEPVEMIESEVTRTVHEVDKNVLLKIELTRLEKLHSDQVELGINPDAKLEVLITNLRTEINK